MPIRFDSPCNSGSPIISLLLLSLTLSRVLAVLVNTCIGPWDGRLSPMFMVRLPRDRLGWGAWVYVSCPPWAGRDRWPGDVIALDVRCAQQIYLPCTFFCCEFIDNNELMHPRELNNRKQIILSMVHCFQWVFPALGMWWLGRSMGTERKSLLAFSDWWARVLSDRNTSFLPGTPVWYPLAYFRRWHERHEFLYASFTEFLKKYAGPAYFWRSTPKDTCLISLYSRSSTSM